MALSSESSVQALRDCHLFVIIYIIVATISVSLVNVIFRILRLVMPSTQQTVSPTVPLRILQQCLREFDRIDNCKHEQSQPATKLKYECVVFGGGGYKTVQYIGYVAYLLRHDLIDEHTKFIGSSLGACCSMIAAIAYNIHQQGTSVNEELIRLFSYLLVHTIEARMNILHLCGNWWNEFESSLMEILDKFNVDMSLFDNAKLEIVTTALFPLPTKQSFTKFESEMDLLNAIKASCMIPFWSMNSPLFVWKNNCYVDGGFTDLVPEGTSSRNLIVYNEAAMYRTFVPLLHEKDYIDEIVSGYIKCKERAQL